MNQIKLRPATPADADRLAALLNQIIDAGGTTAHLNPFDGERLLNHYLAPPLAISCIVAVCGYSRFCKVFLNEWNRLIAVVCQASYLRVFTRRGPVWFVR